MSESIDLFSQFRPKDSEQDLSNPFQTKNNLKRASDESDLEEEEEVSEEETEEEEEEFSDEYDDIDDEEEDDEEIQTIKKPKPQIVTKLDINDPKVVSVSNLPFKLKDEGLNEFMSQFGKVKSAFITMKKRRSTGHGLVEFKKESSVTKAIEGSGAELEGRPITIEESIDENIKVKVKTEETTTKVTEKANSPSSTLYAHNLNWPIDKDALTKLFEAQFPKVKVQVGKRKLAKVEKGFAFIEFESVKESEQALKKFNESEFNGKKLHLSFAKPKSNSKKNKKVKQSKE